MRKWIIGLITASTATTGGVMYGDARMNPYEDKQTHYELPIKSDIPQGERVEIAKDRAELTLKGWNDEYAIKITPQIPAAPTFGADRKIDRPFTVAADRPLLSKQMQYRSGDVTAFIEPREGTDNEFDIDFTLHSKPDTNVFTYKIEGAEAFDFLYQPELTPEEIAEGKSRPENVIGSYAVYHKTKANHRIGSTNYATGKAFHIYRPKAIDANGAEVWAELSYSDGEISVTVPERWLEKAVYPVVVDPTFGHTSLGASNVTIATVTSDTSTMNGSRFSFKDKGTITQISVGLDLTAGISPATSDIFAGVYIPSQTVASFPKLVGVTRTAVSVSSTEAFYDFTASSDSFSVGSHIVTALADGEDLTGTQTISAKYDALGNENIYNESTTGAGSFAARVAENPWTETIAVGSQRMSAYITYTSTNEKVYTTGDTGASIGFCYTDGTATCFTTFSSPNSNARIGWRTGANLLSITTGFRFENVDIPQGATINSALFTYTPFDNDSTNPPTIKIFAEDIDDSPSFTTTGVDQPKTTAFGGSRATTTANISWTLPSQIVDATSTSPNISSVIQEVVDRAGWASGNDLSIILGPSDFVDNFNAQNATSSAYLSIEYAPPTGTTPQSIIWFD